MHHLFEKIAPEQAPGTLPRRLFELLAPRHADPLDVELRRAADALDQAAALIATLPRYLTAFPPDMLPDMTAAFQRARAAAVAARMAASAHGES